MQSVGITYGSIGTTEFKFAVSREIQKHSYIQVKHENEGFVLAQVMELERVSSISFEDARRISFGVDVKIKDKLSANAVIVGYRDNRNILQIPRTPLSAGIPVYNAEEEFIKQVLGLKKDNGAYLGLLKWHNIKVLIDYNDFINRHTSVLAKTGSGKSYLTAVLIEELLKTNIPIVIIDPHGEYSSLIHPNINENDFKLMQKFGTIPRGYQDRIMEYSPDTEINKNCLPLKFEEYNLDAKELVDLTELKSNVHISILRKAVYEIQEEKTFYTIDDIIEKVKEDSNNAKWAVVDALEVLNAVKIFEEKGTSIYDLVKEKQATIINLRGIAPNIQQIVVERISKQLFDARKLNKIPQLVFVVEEGHNFCPQSSTAISSQILKTIASEGRKFGLGLLIVSQRPAIVDKNVLSQCGIQIILKITNPNDLKAIIASVEGLTSATFDEIQRLPIGVAMIVGGNILMPILIDVRVRETKSWSLEEVKEKE